MKRYLVYGKEAGEAECQLLYSFTPEMVSIEDCITMCRDLVKRGTIEVKLTVEF